MNIEDVREYALTLAGANEDIIRPESPAERVSAGAGATGPKPWAGHPLY